MSRTIVSFALAIASVIMGGCMTTREISTSTAPNGTVTKTERSVTGWTVSPGYYTVPYDYGWSYGGYGGSSASHDPNLAPRSRACTGSFGQVIDRVCYHTKPHWMR